MELSHDGEEIDLSCLDNRNAKTELVFCAFFESLISKEKFEESLKKTLNIFYPLSSVLKKRNPNDEKKLPKFYLKCKTPSNFSINEDFTEEESIFEAGIRKDKIVNLKTDQKLREMIPTILSSSTSESEEKVFSVSIIKNKKLNKSILCISISHAVVDIHSFLMFFEQWSKNHSDLKKNEENWNFEKEFFQKRTKIFKASNDYKNKVISSEVSKKLGFWRDVDQIGNRVAFSKILTTVEIQFSKESIQKLKKEAKNEEDEKLIISSNDILCAHFLKLFGIMRDTSNTTDFPLLIHIDLRNRFKDKFEGNFFGNGVITLSKIIKRSHILNSSLSDLSKISRDLIKNLKWEDIEDYVDFHQNVEFPFKKMEYDWLNGTNFNDWRRLSEKSFSFGNEKVTRIHLPAKFLLPSFFILKKSSNLEDENIIVSFAVELNIWNKIKDLDLTSTSCYKNLREMFMKSVQVDEIIFEKYKLIKSGKLKFLVIGINFDTMTITVFKEMEDNGEKENETIKALKEALPDEENRMFYYNLSYLNNEGQKREKIVYVYWNPNTKKSTKETITKKMIYSSNHAILKKDCHWSAFFQMDDKNDISEETWKKETSKFN